MPVVVSASLLSFIVATAVTPGLIWLLKHFHLTQPIRKELPAGHQLKHGTPLMAGLTLFTGVIISLVYSPNSMTLFLSVTFVLFSVVGFLDDFWKASRQDPRGISGKMKLVLQFLFTGVLFFYLFTRFQLDTVIPIWTHLTVALQPVVFFVIISLFVVGSANAINFTDGLDGLLTVVAIPTYFFFFLITSSSDIRVFCITMIASLIAFLIYNVYPAKAFMGDTGSLAIGGTLAMLAVIEKVEILVPLLFIIYFAEQFSVIFQVFYFKRTGKRLFRMSPIHYHFGLKYGWTENTIVLAFGAISWMAMLICFAYYHFAMRR